MRSPDDPALKLIDAGFVVDQRANVIGNDDAAHLGHVSVAVHCDLG